MARILLIKACKSIHRECFILSPPLGLLYLIAYTREKRKNDVFFFHDERTDFFSEHELKNFLIRNKPDIIGISALTIEGIRAGNIARVAKMTLPDSKVLVGGPYACSFGEQLLQDTNLDYVFTGESEISFVKFLDAFDRGETCPDIPNVAYRLPDGRLKKAEPLTELVDLEMLPVPAWDYIDFGKYDLIRRRMNVVATGDYAVLFTSRGCPWHCTFCHNIFGKRYRAMSANKVVDEMEYIIRRFSVSDFEIVDDVFNLDYERAMNIFDIIRQRGLRVRLSFPNGIRGDIMDGRFIESMRAAGTVQMAFAIESASPRIQKKIRKNNDLRRIKENITIAADNGIFTTGFFMLGFPGETRKEIMKTIKMALDSDLQVAHFFMVIYQEGTEIRKQVCKVETSLDDVEFTDYYIAT